MQVLGPLRLRGSRKGGQTLVMGPGMVTEGLDFSARQEHAMIAHAKSARHQRPLGHLSDFLPVHPSKSQWLPPVLPLKRRR